MNQELEQYLRFFTEYRQSDWLEWLVIAKFVVNNKVHTATKVSSFMANYSRELWIGVDIRRKEKVENAIKFAERIRKVQEEAGAALRNFIFSKKYLKNLKIPISILSFVDNGLLISQDKSILVSNVNLFYSYNVIFNLFTKIRLIMKHRKTEVFHFSRLQSIFNPPPLDLTPLGGSVL